jgi:hypothetical protein
VSRVERQAAFLLRAYPQVWREARGDEVLGTVLDLAGDRRWVPPRLAIDLLARGWQTRSRQHVGAVGLAAAGWRTALGIAVVAQVALSLVWLRDWVVTGTPAILAHFLGGASTATYLGALVAFVVAGAAWLGGWQRTARVAAVLAMTAWLLTTVVFHAMSNPVLIDWLQVAPWTYLAGVATIGLFQAPPTHARAVGAIAVVVVVASQIFSTGVEPVGPVGYLVVEQGQLPIALLDRGADTLHTALRTGWVALALTGLALVNVDPRPAVAVGWLLPFLALDHLYWGGPFGLVTGVIVACLVIAYALSSGGLPRTGDGGHLQA